MTQNTILNIWQMLLFPNSLFSRGWSPGSLPGTTFAMVTFPGRWQPARPRGSEGAQGSMASLVTKRGAEGSLEKAVKCQISTFKAQPRADFPRAAALPRPKSRVPRSLAALLGGSSFKDGLFLNNFPTVCDTDRLFFDTRRACLLAPAISFLDKHMYCRQGEENPTHHFCLSSLCPMNNIPVSSWHQSILIHIQHCFPGFPFGH